MKISVPEEVEIIIESLRQNGYEAYAVGGCVRDSLLGGEPKDWDICTSALPEQTKLCFARHRMIETGLRHGTVTLMMNHRPFEITTYRVEDAYTDNRRPDHVEFVGSLEKDLSRRDFTINAMAFSPGKGLVDLFGGLRDLRAKVIRCVGDADERFREDALRMMRALRLAAALLFSIEDETSAAIFRNASRLRLIAVERVARELNQLLVGPGAGAVLLDYAPVIGEIVPELMAAVGFAQNHPYHTLDVWRHTVKSVEQAPAEVLLRLTMLLHDIAKPDCYTEEDGVGHFFGHARAGSERAEKILKRLKYDNATIEKVTELICYHDTELLPREKVLKRWLNRIGEDALRRLLEVKRADVKAQAAELSRERLAALDAVSGLLDEIIGQRRCFSLKSLAVDGRDLMALGVPEGREVGVMLNRLLELVIDGDAENERDALLKIAGELRSEE